MIFNKNDQKYRDPVKIPVCLFIYTDNKIYNLKQQSNDKE